MFLKHDGTPRVSANHKLIDYAATAVAKLLSLWHRTNVPIVTETSIRRCIISLVKKYYAYMKHSTTLTGE